LDHQDLALLLGVHWRTIYRWESGDCRPQLAHLCKLAEVLNTNVSALVDDEPPEDVANLPVVAPSIGEQSEVGVQFQLRFESSPEKAFALRLPEEVVTSIVGGVLPPGSFLTIASGNSGEPFIPDGQAVLVVPTSEFIEGARYAIRFAGTAADVIKRVELRGGGFIALRSDNPAVGDRVIRSTDVDGVFQDESGLELRLEIRGRVIWPSDTPAAVSGKLIEFAQLLLASKIDP